MARRSDHTRPELVALVLETGWKMLSDEGLAHFSARKLATEIGYSVGTVTQLFGGVDGLIMQLNAHTLDVWYDALENAIQRYRGKEPLVQLGREYLAFSRAHPKVWLALFTHQPQTPTPLPDWYEEKLKRFFTLTESLIDPGTAHKKRISQAAQVLWAGIHGIAMLALTDKLDVAGKIPPETLAESLVKTYVQGMQNA